MTSPVDELARHRPPGRCQFCGGERRPSLTCIECAATPLLDCRPRSWTVPCSEPGCHFRGQPGADAHDVLVEGVETFWCERHCPSCAPPVPGAAVNQKRGRQ